MNAISIFKATPSLLERAEELRETIQRLRKQYHQAQAKAELGPPRDLKVLRLRTVAHRQLSILVPMLRALEALAQQGDRATKSAKGRYLEQVSKAVAMADRMVAWVDGSEEEYGELLNLRVPVDNQQLYLSNVEVMPLRSRMEARRHQQEAEEAACETLVSKLLESFTPEQRDLLTKYHRLSRGAALRLVPEMFLEKVHA